jgi:hypothetical protein
MFISTTSSGRTTTYHRTSLSKYESITSRHFSLLLIREPTSHVSFLVHFSFYEALVVKFVLPRLTLLIRFHTRWKIRTRGLSFVSELEIVWAFYATSCRSLCRPTTTSLNTHARSNCGEFFDQVSPLCRKTST